MEGFPSGQREQTVNLPALRLRWFESNPLQPGTPEQQAGIAQLVERQPSKLNVAGSSPVARLIDAQSARRSILRPRERSKDLLRKQCFRRISRMDPGVQD